MPFDNGEIFNVVVVVKWDATNYTTESASLMDRPLHVFSNCGSAHFRSIAQLRRLEKFCPIFSRCSSFAAGRGVHPVFRFGTLQQKNGLGSSGGLDEF